MLITTNDCFCAIDSVRKSVAKLDPKAVYEILIKMLVYI